jgi:hypothetical protein
MSYRKIKAFCQGGRISLRFLPSSIFLKVSVKKRARALGDQNVALLTVINIICVE